ncbi:MAG: 4-oxalocrotonate tautomerase family protein [Iphinoe sp. HA4291-MV1]|jgi:4-oxalocrotonate tautomerase|nr:4-oxalocrotonate tautomerase family protein [Iphinoe sp. HA4291-MV1]
MPFITIQIAESHSIELKRKLMQAVTHALVSTLGTKPEWVTVHIDKFERENWVVGGVMHSDKHSDRHDEKTVKS